MARKQAAVQERERASCIHHWVIESPAGPLSKGVCLICGEKKDFRNAVEEGAWEGRRRRRQWGEDF